MSKNHPLNSDIKNTCAVLVKEITGNEIKKVIPEGESRLKLYQVYQRTWTEKQNYSFAEKAVRKWLTDWEKSKAAVKLCFYAIHDIDIKDAVKRNSPIKRSEFYWCYLEEGEKSVINMIKKYQLQ